MQLSEHDVENLLCSQSRLVPVLHAEVAVEVLTMNAMQAAGNQRQASLL